MLSDVYRKVTTRLKGAVIQLQVMQHEDEERGDDDGADAAGPGDGAAGLLGFGKAERLSGLGVGGSGKLKGGLVKKHTFQVLHIRCRRCLVCSMRVAAAPRWSSWYPQ